MTIDEYYNSLIESGKVQTESQWKRQIERDQERMYKENPNETQDYDFSILNKLIIDGRVSDVISSKDLKTGDYLVAVKEADWEFSDENCELIEDTIKVNVGDKLLITKLDKYYVYLKSDKSEKILKFNIIGLQRYFEKSYQKEVQDGHKRN